MSVPDYTLVVGVDAYHLQQLAVTWPTWKRHKPSLLEHPMVVFYEEATTSEEQVRMVVNHPDLATVPWPIPGLEWDKTKEEKGDKFHNPHRAMMLSGFVYAPSISVSTPYWLKLDTDVVATGMDDWIDPTWFDDKPVIIAHRWSFTKPPDQMLQLDYWVEKNLKKMPKEFIGMRPLNLVPKPDWTRLTHNRIISWCGFFETAWTFRMALTTRQTNNNLRLPVPSQDGFLWYMATRGGKRVERTNMKSRGFSHWSTWGNVKKYAREAMR